MGRTTGLRSLSSVEKSVINRPVALAFQSSIIQHFSELIQTFPSADQITSTWPDWQSSVECLRRRGSLIQSWFALICFNISGVGWQLFVVLVHFFGFLDWEFSLKVSSVLRESAKGSNVTKLFRIRKESAEERQEFIQSDGIGLDWLTWRRGMMLGSLLRFLRRCRFIRCGGLSVSNHPHFHIQMILIIHPERFTAILSPFRRSTSKLFKYFWHNSKQLLANCWQIETSKSGVNRPNKSLAWKLSRVVFCRLS